MQTSGKSCRENAKLFPRHCERSEAIHLSTRAEAWIACCARNDADMASRSRDMICPRFSSYFALASIRGRREGRVRAAPAVPCAIAHSKSCTRAYRFGGSIPAFPAQWLYGLSRALPGENGSFASVAQDRLSPFPNLTPAIAASEPHDFTVRLRHAPSLAPSASIASHRAFVTIASAPHLRW